MPDTIFLDDFPIVKTNQQLEEIKKKFPTHYDEYYIASGCSQERKAIFDRLWKNFKPYADAHFLTEVKTRFHQRTWEMYMGNVLMMKDQIIASSPKGAGPDFIVNDKLYLECVACTRGHNTEDVVREMKTGVGTVPVDKIVLRITNSLDEKSRKYLQWRRSDLINEETPYIIAINIADLDYPENPGMPYVIQALFGFQFLQINLKTKIKSFTHRFSIEKSSQKPILLNYFVTEKYSFISAVIFSKTNVLNHPERIGQDCIFVNNPFAKNIVPDYFKKSFRNWTASVNKGNLKLIRNYDI